MVVLKRGAKNDLRSEYITLLVVPGTPYGRSVLLEAWFFQCWPSTLRNIARILLPLNEIPAKVKMTIKNNLQSKTRVPFLFVKLLSLA